MSVTYLVRFEVVPEQRECFLFLLNGVLDAMRNEPTFQEAVLHVDPVDESRMMLYETWENHDDVVSVQLHRAYREKWHAALPALLREPRVISTWQRLRADRAEAATLEDARPALQYANP